MEFTAVVPGTALAPSPDGRTLAYVRHGTYLYVESLTNIWNTENDSPSSNRPSVSQTRKTGVLNQAATIECPDRIGTIRWHLIQSDCFLALGCPSTRRDLVLVVRVLSNRMGAPSRLEIMARVEIGIKTPISHYKDIGLLTDAHWMMWINSGKQPRQHAVTSAVALDSLLGLSVWDFSKNEEVYTLPSSLYYRFAITQDGRCLIAAGNGGGVVFSLLTASESPVSSTLRSTQHESSPHKASMAVTGKWCVGRNRSNSSDREHVHNERLIRSIACSQWGDVVAILYQDLSMEFWSTLSHDENKSDLGIVPSTPLMHFDGVYDMSWAGNSSGAPRVQFGVAHREGECSNTPGGEGGIHGVRQPYLHVVYLNGSLELYTSDGSGAVILLLSIPPPLSQPPCQRGEDPLEECISVREVLVSAAPGKSDVVQYEVQSAAEIETFSHSVVEGSHVEYPTPRLFACSLTPRALQSHAEVLRASANGDTPRSIFVAYTDPSCNNSVVSVRPITFGEDPTAPNTKSIQPLRTDLHHRGSCVQLAWSPSGQCLAMVCCGTATSRTTLYLWEETNASCVRIPTQAKNVFHLSAVTWVDNRTLLLISDELGLFCLARFRSMAGQ